jgi:kynurenine formamidase
MPQITYCSHAETPEIYGKVYGLEPKDFPEGMYCAIETLTLTTHDTTHMDAPWHYYPTSEGKPARTIDQVPLEWCYSDGVVLDFHHKKKGEGITPSELEEALKKIGYQLKPFDIVLIRTDIYKHYGDPGYQYMHAGMTREATLWLIEHGIKVMGIDAWGWDRPHDVTVTELKAGRKERFWESHLLGKEKEYCHIERMANLDKLPRPFGFKVATFPIKIEGASGAWVRAVAIMEQ